MDANFKAEHLKKVSVTVSPECGNDAVSAESRSFEFIYGIGVEGLTPFESVIAGARTGDTIPIQIGSEDIAALFGHLLPCGAGFPETPQVTCLNVCIGRISEPTPREVVRAIAGNASCGSDCGCGCGSH